MKQHITQDQLDKLTREQRKVLWNWIINPPNNSLYKKDCINELLSIGEMIEFIEDHQEYEPWYEDILKPEGLDIFPKYKGELCDALWLAVKNILEAK